MKFNWLKYVGFHQALGELDHDEAMRYTGMQNTVI